MDIIIIATVGILVSILAEYLIVARARARAEYQERMDSRLAYYAVRHSRQA